MNRLVSIIIPFLNGSEWLKEAVASVVNQTYTDWELILVDDGSSPNESAVAQSMGKNEKITYLDHPSHENRGVSISRNLGAAHAKGSYLAFLDADDYWLPNKLHRQLQLFTEHPTASMICESSQFWRSWQNEKDLDEIVAVGVKPNVLYQPMELITKLYPLGKGAPPCPSGIIVRKEAFERVHGFETSFTSDLQLYEDQGFLTKMYLHEAVFISGDCNNKYRKHEGSITDSGNDPAVYIKSRLYFLDWFKNYVSRKNLLTPLIQTAMADAHAAMDQ